MNACLYTVLTQHKYFRLELIFGSRLLNTFASINGKFCKGAR